MKNKGYLDLVKGFDTRHPKWICNSPAFKWAWLFTFDFIFRVTKSSDSNGNYMLKSENKSWFGRQFKKLDKESVESLIKRNAQHQYTEPVPLPSIDAKDFSKDFFRFWKREINMPIVIKNYLEGAPILDMAEKEQLIKLHGKENILCIKNLTDKVNLGENVSLKKTTLEEFLISDEFEEYYVNNFYGILKDEDFYAKAKGKEIEDIQGKKNLLAQWFISRKKLSGTTLHCASGDNIFLNIKGKKEWHFIDRTYTPVLQPIFSKYALYAVSELKENMNEDYYTSLCRNYPYLKHMPVYKCVLEEGDVLFNPPFWWHRVHNLTSYTVACATRYVATKEDANALAFTICTLFDILRHPTKSAIPTMIKASLLNRKGDFLKSVFSKK